MQGLSRLAQDPADAEDDRCQGLFLALNFSTDGKQVIEAEAQVVVDQLAAARLVGTDRRRWLAGSTVECLYLKVFAARKREPVHASGYAPGLSQSQCPPRTFRLV